MNEIEEIKQIIEDIEKVFPNLIDQKEVLKMALEIFQSRQLGYRLSRIEKSLIDIMQELRDNN